MRWPWQQRETRESQPFTDAIVNAILETNTGAAASTTATAAVESAAGLLGRAFAGAKVSPDNAITESLTPAVLNLIGRDMVRRGESLWVIGVSEGAVSLHPAGSWDVRGDPVGHGRGEAGWYYRLDLFGPSLERDALPARQFGVALPVRCRPGPPVARATAHRVGRH